MVWKVPSGDPAPPPLPTTCCRRRCVCRELAGGSGTHLHWHVQEGDLSSLLRLANTAHGANCFACARVPALGQVEMLEAADKAADTRDASLGVTVFDQLSRRCGMMLISGVFMWSIIDGCSESG